MTDKLLENPGALMNMVRRVALRAGDIVMDHYDSLDPGDVTRKQDGSPVSKADQAAERYIENALRDMLPAVPFIGEEAFAEGRADDVAGAPFFWLVDALDGTKEFITGGEDFTVNIALIREGIPFLGVVYAPVTETLYAGHSGETAVKWTAETDKDKPIHVRQEHPAGLIIVGSKSHGNPEKVNEFLDRFKVQKLLKRGSSLKICVIAEGKADLYPRFGPTSEWDTAAGHAVLRAAGGYLTTTDGTELQYQGKPEDILNPEFIASGFPWYADSGDSA